MKNLKMDRRNTFDDRVNMIRIIFPGLQALLSTGLSQASLWERQEEVKLDRTLPNLKGSRASTRAYQSNSPNTKGLKMVEDLVSSIS